VPSAVKVEIKGGREIERALKKLPAAIASRVLEKAVIKGGKFLEGKIRDRAPVGETSKLKDSIDTQVKDRRGAGVTVQVGPSYKKRGMHAHLVEFGTKPHLVRAGTSGKGETGKKALADDGVVFGASAVVAARPRPFMRPAWDANKGQTLKVIEAGLWQGIRREAARLRGRTR
jgi:HK97 gp10 family phage protein